MRNWLKRKNSEPREDKKLTLIEHLTELRKRIIYSALAFIVAVGFSFSSVQTVINAIIGIAEDVDFVFIAPAELLMAYVKLSVVSGLVLAAPFMIFQLWLFIMPGLESKEKRYILFALVLGSLFFVVGVVFAYLVVAPTMITFFMRLQVEAIKPMISFESYLSFILSTFFTFGVVFELPIVMVLLSRFGILKARLMKRYRKYIVLIIFILAAILTPPDVISQIILAVPMLLLVELGIFLAGIAEKKSGNERLNEE